MPDIGHIVGAWGQVILRSKEWRSDTVILSGGVMAWVLYAPEDGSALRTIDGWMPFQLRWDIPPDSREGDIRITALLRSVDARSVSARKIMARAGVAAMAEAFSPMEAEAFVPDAGDGEIELLRTTYPLRLPREAGEKTFLLDEELTLPDSAPAMEQLIYYRMEPRILDKKVLGGKAVFRGNGNLHMLYQTRDGQLQSWDFDLPFSQFAELSREHSSDAQMDLSTMVTALELEPMEDRLRLKAGLVAQYLISDRELLELIEDAYAPGREITLQTQVLEIPTLLDARREMIYPEQDAQGAQVVDTQFLPDFPIQRRTENDLDLELPGVFQILCRGEDGSFRQMSPRWSGQHSLAAHENTIVTAIPIWEPQSTQVAKAELALDFTTTASQSIPMVMGVEVGQPIAPDPARPSLILKRAGEGRLWDIAKAMGTTMSAIQKANNLQDDPAPNQILLIPVP